VRAAQSVLDDLATAAMQSCHLVVAEGAEAVVLATAASPMPMGYAVRVGARFPLMETSSGVVIVAFGRERVRRAAFADEAPEDYAERIERVRRRGYEVWDSHVVRGVTNGTAPELDHSGHACAAVTVPYLKQIRAEPSRSDVLARAVEAGAALSRAMSAAERPETDTIPSREAEG
jgi:DNA-binding IclR family transcriptional regulator